MAVGSSRVPLTCLSLYAGKSGSSACLVDENGILAFAEEDRLTRKFQEGVAEPELSRHFCLRQFGHKEEDLTAIIRVPDPRISAQEAKAAAAIFHSGFDEAVCLVIDDEKDSFQTSVWVFKNQKITLLYSSPFSLASFYSGMTELAGFRPKMDEYKMMGLAAYGKNDFKMDLRLEVASPLTKDGGYEIPPIFRGRETEDWDREDFAYAVQKRTEDVVVHVVRNAVLKTGISNVCLAGEIALNIKANAALMNRAVARNLFAHPLSGPSGYSVSAAVLYLWKKHQKRVPPLKHLVYGPSFSDAQIKTALEKRGIPHVREGDIASRVADALSKGKIVGWFQGRMEAGPRALGQRSILAVPSSKDVADRVNALVKLREKWRPFCPSLPEESAFEYFDKAVQAPFMNEAFKANALLRRKAPGIVHVDGTCRVQTVDEAVLPLFHRLLKAVGERTGMPVLLNTSMNVKDMPIVCSPDDALDMFEKTSLEGLAIGDFYIEKNGVSR